MVELTDDNAKQEGPAGFTYVQLAPNGRQSPQVGVKTGRGHIPFPE